MSAPSGLVAVPWEILHTLHDARPESPEFADAVARLRRIAIRRVDAEKGAVPRGMSDPAHGEPVRAHLLGEGSE